MKKVLAYRHSQETDGMRGKPEEVEIIDSRQDDGTTTYIVRTQDGIVCTAIYNIFADAYFASDIFGIVKQEVSRTQKDLEM